MTRHKHTLDPQIFDLQCEILAAARQHGATNRSIAAALADTGAEISCATVSHFTTSSRPVELTLSHLVAIAGHAGNGRPAGQVLGPLLAHLGLVAKAPGEDEVCHLRVIKESSDVIAAYAAEADLDVLERELMESITVQEAALEQVRRKRLRARGEVS